MARKLAATIQKDQAQDALLQLNLFLAGENEDLYVFWGVPTRNFIRNEGFDHDGSLDEHWWRVLDRALAICLDENYVAQWDRNQQTRPTPEEAVSGIRWTAPVPAHLPSIPCLVFEFYPSGWFVNAWMEIDGLDMSDPQYGRYRMGKDWIALRLTEYEGIALANEMPELQIKLEEDQSFQYRRIPYIPDAP